MELCRWYQQWLQCSMGILSAVFTMCTCTTLFAKLCNSGVYFWPPYILMQQFKCFAGAKVPFKTRPMIFFKSQCLKTTRAWQNYLITRIMAPNHQWDTTTVDNPKFWAQTLNQINKLLHISIGKGSIANLLKVCRLKKHCRLHFKWINWLTFVVSMVHRSNRKERSSCRSRLGGYFSCIHIWRQVGQCTGDNPLSPWPINQLYWSII